MKPVKLTRSEERALRTVAAGGGKVVSFPHGHRDHKTAEKLAIWRGMLWKDRNGRGIEGYKMTPYGEAALAALDEARKSDG